MDEIRRKLKSGEITTIELLEQLEHQKTKLSLEQSRLAGEQKVFEMQKKTLELGFAKLAADKEAFAAEKKKLLREIREFEMGKATGSYTQGSYPGDDEDDADARGADRSYDAANLSLHTPGYFGGIEGYASLKRRYKDLMKIYHPDNKHGDTFTVACINKEYEQLKERFKLKKHKD